MAARNAKGQFVKKAGGRSHGKKRSGGRRHAASRALVIRESVSISPRGGSVARKAKGRKGRAHHGGGGVTIGKLLGAGVLLGSAAETNNGPLGPTVYNVVQKLPGVKTFGGAITAGLYLGAVGKYTRLGRGRIGPWLRAAGVIGVAGAALKLGAQGTKFQWLGVDTADPYMRVR